MKEEERHAKEQNYQDWNKVKDQLIKKDVDWQEERVLLTTKINEQNVEIGRLEEQVNQKQKEMKKL